MGGGQIKEECSTHLFWALASCRFKAYSAQTLWESINSLSHGWIYLLNTHEKEHQYFEVDIGDHNSSNKHFTTNDAQSSTE